MQGGTPPIPMRNAVVIWQVCLYDADGGPNDFIWRTALFSTQEKAEAWVRTQGCAYQMHKMVVDEPMFGWDEVH